MVSFDAPRRTLARVGLLVLALSSLAAAGQAHEVILDDAPNGDSGDAEECHKQSGPGTSTVLLVAEGTDKNYEVQVQEWDPVGMMWHNKYGSDETWTAVSSSGEYSVSLGEDERVMARDADRANNGGNHDVDLEVTVT